MNRYHWNLLLLRLDVTLEVRAVACALSFLGNADGSNMMPGDPRLAASVGLSDRQLGEHVGVLRRLKLLHTVRRGGGRGGAGTLAVCHLSEPADGGLLPMRLDDEYRPLEQRPKGRVPVKAIEASKGRRSPAEAVPAFSYDRNPASGQNPVDNSIDQNCASAQSPVDNRIDRNLASGETPIDRKASALSPEAQPRLTGSPASDSLDKPLTPTTPVVSFSGDLTSAPDPDRPPSRLRPTPPPAQPEYDAARIVLAALPPDEVDPLLAVAKNELAAEGRYHADTRELIIRAALIAARCETPDPCDPENPDA